MQTGRNRQRERRNAGVHPFAILTAAVLDAVSKLGWWGAILFGGAIATDRWASPEQKQQIIDMYLLMRWHGNYWCLLSVSALVVLVFLAQRHHYKVRLGAMQNELDRVSNEKTRLQEAHADRSLHHSDGR